MNRFKINIIHLFLLFLLTISSSGAVQKSIEKRFVLSEKDKKAIEKKIKETLSCDKTLKCNIPKNTVGLSCNSKELQWIIDKKKKTLSQPKIHKEFMIKFENVTASFTTHKIQWGNSVDYMEKKNKKKKSNLELLNEPTSLNPDSISDFTLTYQWSLDRKTLLLNKFWDYETEKKNNNSPHVLKQTTIVDRSLGIDYIRIYKNLNFKCKIVDTLDIIKPTINEILEAKKNNKI